MTKDELMALQKRLGIDQPEAKASDVAEYDPFTETTPVPQSDPAAVDPAADFSFEDVAAPTTAPIDNLQPTGFTPAPADDFSFEDVAAPVAAAPVDPSTQDPSLMDTIGRQVGLTARAGAQGVADLAGIVTGPLDYINDSIFGTTSTPISEEMRMTLDDLGLPKPEGALENIVQAVGAAAVGGGAGVKVAQEVAAVSQGTAKIVADVLAQNAGAQIAASASSGGAAETAKEAGFGATGQVVAALLGSLAPAGVAKVSSTVANEVKSIAKSLSTAKDPAAKALTKQAKQLFGIVTEAAFETALERKDLMKALAKEGTLPKALESLGIPTDKIASVMKNTLIRDNETLGLVKNAAEKSITDRAIVAGDKRVVADNFVNDQRSIAGQNVDAVRTNADPEMVNKTVLKLIQNELGSGGLIAKEIKKSASEILETEITPALRKATGYALTDKPKLHLDEATGEISIVKKNANPNTDGVYAEGELFPIKNDANLTSKVTSSLEAQIAGDAKAGGAPDQIRAEQLAGVKADVIATENSYINGLKSANKDYETVKNFEGLQKATDGIFEKAKSGNLSAVDIAALDDAGKAAGLIPADRLRAIEASIDGQIAMGKDATKLLDAKSRIMDGLLKETLKKSGFDGSQVNDFEKFVREIDVLDDISGLKGDSLRKNIVSNIVSGSKDRIYLGLFTSIKISVFKEITSAVMRNGGNVLLKRNPELDKLIANNLADITTPELAKIFEAASKMKGNPIRNVAVQIFRLRNLNPIFWAKQGTKATIATAKGTVPVAKGLRNAARSRPAELNMSAFGIQNALQQ